MEFGGVFVQETPGSQWHRVANESSQQTICGDEIVSDWDWQTTGIMLPRLVCMSCLIATDNGCDSCKVGDHYHCTAEAGDCTTICHPVVR